MNTSSFQQLSSVLANCPLTTINLSHVSKLSSLFCSQLRCIDCISFQIRTSEKSTRLFSVDRATAVDILFSFFMLDCSLNSITEHYILYSTRRHSLNVPYFYLYYNYGRQFLLMNPLLLRTTVVFSWWW